MKKRILLTGGTGLVGAHFINKFQDEYNIYALVRSKPIIYSDNVTYCEFDFAQAGKLTGLPKKMDAIIHLAQSNRMRDFPLHALDIFNVNVNSTALLLDYAQHSGVTHFIYASTGGLYRSSIEPCYEMDPVKLNEGPLGYYFGTKYASETLIQTFKSLMSVQILRPFFIYGQNQKNDMFIPRLIDNVRQGRPITLQGENGILVNPVYVDDAVSLISECLSVSDGLTINVAGSEVLSIREISEIIGSYISNRPVFTMVSPSEGNILGNNDLMRSILNRPLSNFHINIESFLAGE